MIVTLLMWSLPQNKTVDFHILLYIIFIQDNKVVPDLSDDRIKDCNAKFHTSTRSSINRQFGEKVAPVLTTIEVSVSECYYTALIKFHTIAGLPQNMFNNSLNWCRSHLIGLT